ncbi:MAG: DUF5683 domain-containing protein [Bacteroidales bacterium]|jgi:hypothetical protein|nr:DUF5683 domain-containing protein [Bacteroidales bacterium]
MFRLRIFVITLLSVFSASAQTDTVTFKPVKHNPTRATLYSTVVPGLGQIYNKQAWKVPVIYGAGVVVSYFAITNYKGATKFKTEYYARINNEGERNSSLAHYTDDGVYKIYQNYEQMFELSLIIGGVVYLFNIIDALVYAHLFSFDINDNLSANISPFCIPTGITPFQNCSPTWGLSVNFLLK